MRHCYIYLPNDVRINDVATAMGMLAGLPFGLSKDHYGTCFGVAVEGITMRPTRSPYLVDIVLKGAMIDGSSFHTVYFCYEPDAIGYFELNPPVDAFWFAIGMGLINFFGGYIELEHTNGSIQKIRAKKPRKCNRPSKTQFYARDKFLRGLSAIKPISQSALKQLAKQYKVKI